MNRTFLRAILYPEAPSNEGVKVIGRFQVKTCIIDPSKSLATKNTVQAPAVNRFTIERKKHIYIIYIKNNIIYIYYKHIFADVFYLNGTTWYITECHGCCVAATVLTHYKAGLGPGCMTLCILLWFRWHLLCRFRFTLCRRLDIESPEIKWESIRCIRFIVAIEL